MAEFWRHQLQRPVRLRITVTVSSMMVGAALLTSGITAMIMLPLSQLMAVGRTRQHVISVVELTSTLIDEADVAEIRTPADQNSQAYKRLHQVLNDVVSNVSGAGYAYIWRVSADPSRSTGLRATWIVDNAPVGSKMFRSVGQEYPAGSVVSRDLLQVLKTGKPSADRSTYSDYAGTWLSGYAPIHSRNHSRQAAPNNSLLIVGVDIAAQHVHQYQQNILRNFAGAIALALLISIPAGVGIGRWACTPLRVITQRMMDLSNLNIDPDPKPIPGVWVLEIEQTCEALIRLSLAMSSFALYLPQDVVKKLLASNQIAKRGGSTKNMAIMFTDIRNFTGYTEEADTEVLLEKLNEYFNHTTKEILATSGTIDKFIGDSIMAFWGAPNDLPTPATNACRSALAIRHAYRMLNEQWDKQGVELNFYTRIGIHYGPAVVGNMGSDDRINYTVIGDSVNTASRLEPLGKIYETDIIVSGAVVQAITAEGTASEFKFTRLDEMNVRGKKLSTEIYTLDPARAASAAQPVQPA